MAFKFDNLLYLIFFLVLIKKVKLALANHMSSTQAEVVASRLSWNFHVTCPPLLSLTWKEVK